MHEREGECCGDDGERNAEAAREDGEEKSAEEEFFHQWSDGHAEERKQVSALRVGEYLRSALAWESATRWTPLMPKERKTPSNRNPSQLRRPIPADAFPETESARTQQEDHAAEQAEIGEHLGWKDDARVMAEFRKGNQGIARMRDAKNDALEECHEKNRHDGEQDELAKGPRRIFDGRGIGARPGVVRGGSSSPSGAGLYGVDIVSSQFPISCQYPVSSIQSSSN